MVMKDYIMVFLSLIVITIFFIFFISITQGVLLKDCCEKANGKYGVFSSGLNNYPYCVINEDRLYSSCEALKEREGR